MLMTPNAMLIQSRKIQTSYISYTQQRRPSSSNFCLLNKTGDSFISETEIINSVADSNFYFNRRIFWAVANVPMIWSITTIRFSFFWANPGSNRTATLQFPRPRERSSIKFRWRGAREEDMNEPFQSQFDLFIFNPFLFPHVEWFAGGSFKLMSEFSVSGHWAEFVQSLHEKGAHLPLRMSGLLNS